MSSLPATTCLCAALVSLALPAAAIDWKALARRGTASVVVEMEIGGGEDDGGDLVFVQPTDVCVARDHSFFVVDNDGVIVHFSAAGEELGRIGRQGEGPGEFMRPMWAFFDLKGRLVVYELGNNRFSVLAPDGTFISSTHFQDFVEEVRTTPDGGIVALANPNEAWTPDHKNLTQLVRYDADLTHPAVLDSLRARRVHMVMNKESAMGVSMPYYTHLRFCVLADGSIAYGRTDRYEIRILGPDLSPRTTLRRDVAPRPITDEDRERYYQAFAQNEELVRALKDQLEWPRHGFVFTGLFADGPWLIVVRDGPTLDVFEDGEFLGEVSAPEFRTPRAIDGERYFRPHHAPEALPSVVVYTVR